MAAKKQVRRAPVRRKQRRGLLPKLLLLLGYSAVLAVLGAIFFMKAELRRFGVLGGEPAVSKTIPEQTQHPAITKHETETARASTPNAGEITVEEKKQLEDILRSRSSE